MKKIFALLLFLIFGLNHINAQYCAPVYGFACSSQDFIDNFETTNGLTNISNIGTGCSGTAPNNYTYYAAMNHKANPGDTVMFSILPSWAYQQGVAIYVDWNQDNDFIDPGEEMWSSLPSATLQAGYFIVPASAVSGLTRMRVRSVYSITPTDPCTFYSYGETEDYNFEVMTYTMQQPACGQANGTINYNFSSASNFILNPGNISSTTGYYTNLTSGTYYVSYVINNTSITDTISLVGQLSTTITASLNSFSATVPTNGTPPYAYFLNGQSMSNPVSGLRCTGIDTFNISDAGGCVFDTSLQFIASNSFPSIILNKNITQPSCSLTTNGSIQFAPSVPLSYSWIANSTVIGDTNQNLNNLLADTFVVKLHNAAGDCVQDTSILTPIDTNCGNISGIAFYDTLVNCLGTNQPVLSNVLVTLQPGNLQRITNNLGQYSYIGLPFGNYTVEVDSNFDLHQYPNCNQIQYDTLNVVNNVLENDFAFDPNGSVDYYILSMNTPIGINNNPGSNGRKKTIHFAYTGYSTQSPIPAEVTVIIDSIKHFDYAIPIPTSISGDTIRWNVNVQSSNYGNIRIYYDSLNALIVPDTIPITMWIESLGSPIIGNLSNNDTCKGHIPIRNSCDPNDKTVSPQGIGSQGYIDLSDSVLNYLVRFQNTGNAMAFNVEIADTISTLLNLNSLEVLGASHPYLIERDGNSLLFKFDNIMLPDSNADEPNSHGYIQYRIKQASSNQLGGIIENKAHIYFDFNSAVITNTTINTIGIPVDPTSVKTIIDDQFLIYPNPADSKVFIQALKKNEINSIQLFDLMGREININPIKKNNSLLEISTSELTMGIYLLHINGTTIKLIKE